MDEIVAFLQSVPELRSVPREQLQWLMRESEVRYFEPGLLARPGETNELMDYMIVLLEGTLEASTFQNGQKRIQMTNTAGGMTGILPFSRMKTTPVYVQALERTKALMLPRTKFPALIAENYELTEVLVHSMIDRVRVFTSAHFQNEKLMSLGKLSAGIAHELNNPAAAIVRSAEDMKHTSGSLAEHLRRIAEVNVSQAQANTLLPIFDRATSSSSRLPLLERKRREETIRDWLERHGLSSDSAEELLTAGFSTADLDSMDAVLSEKLAPLVTWLVDQLHTRESIEEIATAARRISELVQSVKSYTRMDQAQAMEELCINDGIANTVRMLQHKARKNSVEIREELAAGLPLIVGFPGELNQVWTNIIDNALDAMKTGGTLAIGTYSEPDRVIFSAVDSGPGIAPENLQRIFDPFFTTKDVGEGTGVGLDLVQKVVASHHGTIDVTSQPGHTEFRVAFPRIIAS